MVDENALVLYKNKPALVKEKADGKFSIFLQDNTQVKVRDKDIELLHPGPVKNFSEINTSHSVTAGAIHEAWELLLDESETLSLKELASFIFGEYTPSSAYAAYCVLQDGLYFSGTASSVILRSKDEVAAEEAKRNDKQRETDERSQFLERIKASFKNNTAQFSAEQADIRFFQDVEALAYGKSAKSRTMKDLGLSETPEEAHSLLLKTGFWTTAINPHPSRFGLTLNSSSICPDPPPAEDRRDLSHLASFAIDSPWSNDPDDAVSIEADEKSSDNKILYVHIADPAASIMPNSPTEKEACGKGTTLYLPETTVRMLAEEALPLFALGFGEKSLAITFKMTVDKDGNLIDTEIFASVVKVQRMTYEEADAQMNSSDTENAKTLCSLYELAQRIYNRRTSAGAVNIELPEVHISVENGVPQIKPIVQHRCAFMVRECMIAAGEGAGTWAVGRSLAFPYLCQEADMPDNILTGLAGSIQLRKCMRPRILSTKPGRHQGLGLDIYTQVTSPLRRYTDLLAHMQIRSFLRGGKPLSADEVMLKLGAGEAAASAAIHAERSSRNHWIMVYLQWHLADKKDSVWDAVSIESKGNRWAVIIPSLALETQVPLDRKAAPNDNVKLNLKSVNIPRGEAVFESSRSV
jgi:exoribonuclease-2